MSIKIGDCFELDCSCMNFCGNYARDVRNSGAIGIRITSIQDTNEGIEIYSYDNINSKLEKVGGCNCLKMKHLVIKNNLIKHTLMEKVTIMAKKFLSPDTQKLIKAGIIDSNNLELTSKGKAELEAINLEAKMADMLKRADEIIVEQKEEKSK